MKEIEWVASHQHVDIVSLKALTFSLNVASWALWHVPWAFRDTSFQPKQADLWASRFERVEWTMHAAGAWDGVETDLASLNE